VIKNTQIKKDIRDIAKGAHNLLDPAFKKVVIAQKGAGSGLSINFPEKGCSLRNDYNGSTFTFCNLYDKDGTRWPQFLKKIPGTCTQQSKSLIDKKKDTIAS